MPKLHIEKEQVLPQPILKNLQDAASAMQGLENSLHHVQDMLTVYLNPGNLKKERFRASITLQNAMVGDREMLPQLPESNYKIVSTKDVEKLLYKANVRTAKAIEALNAQQGNQLGKLGQLEQAGQAQAAKSGASYLPELEKVQKMTTHSYIGLRSGFSLLANPVVSSGKKVNEEQKLGANYDTPVTVQEKKFLKNHLSEMGAAITLIEGHAKALNAMGTISPKELDKLPKGGEASELSQSIASLASGANTACKHLKLAHAKLSKALQKPLGLKQEPTSIGQAPTSIGQETTKPAGQGKAPAEGLMQVNTTKRSVNGR